MFNSISYFNENSIPKINNLADDFLSRKTDLCDYVCSLNKILMEFGSALIRDTLEEADQIIAGSVLRKKHYDIVRKDSRKLITSMGEIGFSRRYYYNHESGERVYLLDRYLGLDPNRHLTEDAVAKVLEEAVDCSYEKSGAKSCYDTKVSKQTVKEIIHALEFPKEKETSSVRKVVDYLYIDADEDHVSLQFQNKKGDLTTNQQNHKNNGAINKLIYVYEGVRKVSEEDGRHMLVNPHYFGGIYDGAKNAELWGEVYQYIENNYSVKDLKGIYINGDGAAWIQAGTNYIANSTFILDEFHLEKYITKMTGHMGDSTHDAVSQVRETIKSGTLKDFETLVDRLKDYTEESSVIARIDECAKYILSNWSGAKKRLARKDHIRGCSAEGHVSHILSSRMSSLPMGWSRLGADKMAHLRCYRSNGGNMLELVRNQPEIEQEKKAAGAEDTNLATVREIMNSESVCRKKHGVKGKYAEVMQASVGHQTRVMIELAHHLSL